MAQLTSAGRRLLWIALLVVASAVFSLGFACAVPLAAFAAVAALTLSRGMPSRSLARSGSPIKSPASRCIIIP
jgi:hypothetical protein